MTGGGEIVFCPDGTASLRRSTTNDPDGRFWIDAALLVAGENNKQQKRALKKTLIIVSRGSGLGLNVAGRAIKTDACGSISLDGIAHESVVNYGPQNAKIFLNPAAFLELALERLAGAYKTMGRDQGHIDKVRDTLVRAADAFEMDVRQIGLKLPGPLNIAAVQALCSAMPGWVPSKNFCPFVINYYLGSIPASRNSWMNYIDAPAIRRAINETAAQACAKWQ
jgi:hypothetical protein